jgi:hypothetical protein
MSCEQYILSFSDLQVGYMYEYINYSSFKMFYVKNKWFKLNGKNYHTVLLIEKNDDDKKNGFKL